MCILVWAHLYPNSKITISACVGVEGGGQVSVELGAGLPSPHGVQRLTLPCARVCKPGHMPASLPRVSTDTCKLSFTSVVETLLGHFGPVEQGDLGEGNV